MLNDVLDTRNWAYYNRSAVRAAKRAKKKRLMKEIFGYDVVRSDYLAFNPFHDFELSPFPVTPTNRTVVKVGSSGYPRKRVRKSRDTVHDTVLYAAAPGVNRRHPMNYTGGSSSTLVSNLTSQPRINGFVKDTTKRTRGSMSDFGEAEMFLPRLNVPNSSHHYVPQESELSGEDTFGPYHRIDRTLRTSSGISARITQATVNGYLNLERARFATLAPSVAESLLPRALPSSRSFDFLREFIELKDLPLGIKTAANTARDLYYSGTFDPSSNYLSQEFGWDQLVRSAVDLVQLPDKITKRVNYLLSRLGKSTTFRSKSRSMDVIPGASGFSFDPLIDESIGTPSHVAVRLSEWRLALNYRVKFPELELPKLKEFISSQLWGARFRPDDFYNLIPWSWLVDWFGGLGDFLEAFCAVNDDTSLANYGFLTYESNTTVMSNCQGYFSQTRSTRFNGGPIVTVSTTVPTNHTAVLRYKYLRRIDVTSISDLVRTWVFDELSIFQASILGALAFRR